MNARELDLIRTGYIRGILGLPLTADDAGKTRAQLEAKYSAELDSDIRRRSERE